jgi:Ca-activated chloride channel homolog
VRFAEPLWLAGTGVAVIVAILLVAGGMVLLGRVRRFGDAALVDALVTDRAGRRRALKGSLQVLAVAAGFCALAQPQYGRGTRLVPATNLDVVVVLDYSKSMYAQDVPPSRMARAKAEVGRLIAELPGARFGAVAFAGEPVSFPLTSDGASIAQFFRQLSPNDMPVGGTAIARALEAGRRLLERDPLSKRHEKAILLVTDGEDLEGDPVEVAKSAGANGIRIHVVQIGGRTPEPIPDVSETGEVQGWRRDSSGKPLTTSLSAEGEKQLTEIAEASGGSVVRSEQGETGIPAVARALKRQMNEELSERVETVYADVYTYPAALAALLLLLEAFIPEARRRRRPSALPATTVAALLLLLGCVEDVRDPFLRKAPTVQEAIRAYDAGEVTVAVQKLTEYLSTGPCAQGAIGTPDTVRTRPNASYDLGLALFSVAERFGDPFARAAQPTPGQPPDPSGRRAQEIACARQIVGIVRGDPKNPVSLRAHASFLAGNLELLGGAYREAVRAYDEALRLVPARDDTGDAIARRAAHNRAIALRLAEEAEREPPDAGSPEPPEPGADGGPDDRRTDGGKPDPSRSPDGDEGDPDPADDDAPKQEPEPEEKDGKDGKEPRPDEPQAHPEPPAAEPEPREPSAASQDERMLDALEQAPTVQQEAARRRGRARRVVGMEDK